MKMENKKEDYSFLSDSVPSVINKELLIKSIIDQGPKGEAGRLFLEDGIEFDRVKEIRLEFHRILYIDYLWPMKNLVKLNLSNNVIEKIQGLESLVNLQELNVSFNHITKMENLGTLVKLQTLLLFSNKIKVIEGIDKSENLSILSIGKNEIGDREHVNCYYYKLFAYTILFFVCKKLNVDVTGIVLETIQTTEKSEHQWKPLHQKPWLLSIFDCFYSSFEVRRLQDNIG